MNIKTKTVYQIIAGTSCRGIIIDALLINLYIVKNTICAT